MMPEGFSQNVSTREILLKRAFLPILSRTTTRAPREGVLRGLHYQHPTWQGKLVRALVGEIFDVAVDIRRDSECFGQWFGITLSAQNKKQLYVPPGFAHGFCVLSEVAEMAYKCTALYEPADDAGVLWNDPDIGIEWPVSDPILSAKDSAAPRLNDLPNLSAPN